MSMTGNLLRATEKEILSYLGNSKLLEYTIDKGFGSIEIDESWEGILYILTGQGIADIDKATGPLKWVIVGDNVIDEDQDFGYGPANYSTPQQVKEIDKVLDSITDVDFERMFDAGDKILKGEIYPNTTWPDRNEALSYYLDYFNNVKDFYKMAAENGEAVITYLS